MSNTMLGHRLVRDYLRSLDSALRILPAGQAHELREQITAHLNDALRPDAGDAEVAAALDRLGSPAALAAEAMAAAAASGARQRSPLARVRMRTWIFAGMALVLAGITAGYLIAFLTAGPLTQEGGVATWWYAQDLARRADVAAGDAMQSTVPIRSGQRQGYVVSLYNPTDVTQTVVADGSGPTVGWDSPGGKTSQIGVSARYWTPPDSLGYGLVHRVRYTLPGVIPPHQIRLLRVFWISHICLSKGESTGIGTLFLRVRVGWFTRTETIPLGSEWDLLGPSHGHCG